MVVIEEGELPLYNLLSEHGFDVITVPMRGVYEFGGAIHCCTWDIQREDACTDYFPNQEHAQVHQHFPAFTDIDVVDVSSASEGFVLNPTKEKAIVGTYANKLHRTKDDSALKRKADSLLQ